MPVAWMPSRQNNSRATSTMRSCGGSVACFLTVWPMLLNTAFGVAGTHDVDEAILLADRILLMTNGTDARVAAVVVNTLPHPRERREIHRTPGFHPLRNHIVDFLVTRSKALAGTRPDGWTGRNVPLVFPAETASSDRRTEELT